MKALLVLALYVVAVSASVGEGSDESESWFGSFGGGPSRNSPRTSRVNPVRQFFHATCERRLNDQIVMEFKASHIYLSMSTYFTRYDVSLPGFAKFFKKASDEEREHGIKLIEYINLRGGTVNMSALPRVTEFSQQLTSNDWESATKVLEEAISLERAVNNALVTNVHKCGQDNNDAHLQDYIEGEFLTEQVNSIRELSNLLTKVKRVGNGIGLEWMDKEIMGN